jgi:hypothetical protein
MYLKNTQDRAVKFVRLKTCPCQELTMIVPHAPPTGDENPAAQLTARERRALLEDIGHVALTLGRSLLPPTVTPETSAPDVSPAATLIPASPTAHSRPDALTSPLERLHFLCALWTGLEGALAVIVRQPDSRTACVRQSMPLARSQGSSGAAASVARSPRAAAAWRQIQSANKQLHAPYSSIQTHFPVSLSVAPTQREQTPIVERVTMRVHDTWANRLTVSLLMQIEEEANVLRRLADFCDARQEAAEAVRLARTARRIRVNTFLRECPGLRDSEKAQGMAGDNIGRCSVPYRAVYRAWRSLTHPLDFDWSGSPLLYLPAIEPWNLYEIWCYLQVAAALLHTGWRLTDSDLLRCTPNGMRLVLATGRASRLCFRKEKREEKNTEQVEEQGEGPPSKIQNPKSKIDACLSLYYQPLFASANQTAHRERAQQESMESLEADNDGAKEEIGKKDVEFAFVSRSHAMQPDIALHCNSRLILLDPKFKRYAEGEDAQDDINKMHTYRDAIVRHSRQSKGRSVSSRQNASPVSAAWCLFPGVAAKDEKENGAEAVFHNPLYAYPAATPEAPFGTAEVGAFPLRPGQPDTTNGLAELITALLSNTQ